MRRLLATDVSRAVILDLAQELILLGVELVRDAPEGDEAIEVCRDKDVCILKELAKLDW